MTVRKASIPIQARLAPLSSINAEARTAELVWTTGERVHRMDWWTGEEFLEELSLDPGAIVMDRLNNGAPLLDTHNRWDLSSIIGVVEKAAHDGKRGTATVRFSQRDAVEPIFRDVKDGVIRNVSVGYKVHKFDKTQRDEESGLPIYRAVLWEPMEISLVPIGADAGAGVRAEAQKFPCEFIETEAPQPAARPQTQERSNMTEAATAAAAATAALQPAISAVEAEKERIQTIRDLAKANGIDARTEERWIRDAVPYAKISKEILEVMEERAKAKPLEAARLGLDGKETNRWSLFKALRVLADPSDAATRADAAFELECTEALRKKLGRPSRRSILVPSEILEKPLVMPRNYGKRALDINPGSKGGYLVDAEQGDFIGILRNRSAAMKMGARVLSGLQGNVVFPRQTGKPSVTWQGGGGTSVSAADQTLGQLSITPHTAIVITDVSLQLMQQASPSAEAFVMSDLAQDVAIDGVDAAAINGTGGAQPLGIKNTTGVTTGQDAASATYAKILAFVSTAGAVNAILGNPGFLTNTNGAAKLMQVQRFTSTDTPLWTGNMLDGELVGFNAMSSEQANPASSSIGPLIFGSWDTLVIGEWGVLELDTDTGGTRFNQGQVGIRALWMVDIMLRYPQSFVVSSNLS